MPDLSITATAPAPAPAPVSGPAPASGSSFTFRELLSELNPLQYIPVIGTIYRSVTGDTIPESVRIGGSFVFGALTGGPIGIATSAIMLAVEKATGLDPEKIGHDMLAAVGIGTAEPAPSGAAPATTDGVGPSVAYATAPSADPPAPDRGAGAWSPAQLTAYGIVRTADGGLKRGDLTGSDVLNDLELTRTRGAATVLSAAS